ncbi:hypothetical protein M0805_009220 [Coniferiporia weirii]|nr:hypothetical protein M0805_009220 [Coniferiporia weirii]
MYHAQSFPSISTTDSGYDVSATRNPLRASELNTPDGRQIVSGSNDNTLRIWDAQTGDPVGEPLTGHSSQVLSVAYSPDGRHIVSGSSDKTLRIWDAQTGELVGEPLTGHSNAVLSVAYSPDGRHIVSGSGDSTLRIWDAQTGDPVGEPLTYHSEPVFSVAYSPDGRHIVSGSDDNTLRIWNLESFSSSSHGKPTNGIIFTAGGWFKDPSGGLLFWVPHQYCDGNGSRLLDMSKMCLPYNAQACPVRVDWSMLLKYSGTSWVNIDKDSKIVC